MRRYFIKIIILYTAVLLGAFIGAQPLYAQSSDSEACDSDVQSVMNARARLEAMRQMEMAQALILKPDSVLEYSCFDDRVAEVGLSVNDIFSDNVRSALLFNIPPLQYDASESSAIRIMPDRITAPNTGQQKLLPGPNPPGGDLHSAHMNNVLGIFVIPSMFEFLYSNFGHVYAGGTYSNAGASSACNPMQLVWSFLKCQNINKSSFKTFSQLAMLDPRLQPLPCQTADRTQMVNAMIAASNPMPGTDGGVDPVVTHIAMFNSSSCGAIQPIKTGLIVDGNSSSHNHYEDAICPAAGCYYDGASCR